MKFYRFYTVVCAVVLLMASLAGGPVATAESRGKYAQEDLSTDYSEAGAILVEFSENGVQAGSGVAVADGRVTFSQAGTYVLSGAYSGQLFVEIDKEQKIRLVLDGLQVYCASGPALYVESAEKLILTLAEGSVNALADGENYGQDENGADGAIFSREDLTINGSGSLSVTGQTAHGVVSKDSLVITGGEIHVESVADGLRGKDDVSICGGTVAISSGEDGVQATEDEDAEQGFVTVDGGELRLSAGGRGLVAETAIYVTDGEIQIDAQDDALHSNGDMEISGGTLRLKTGDDGAHADGTLIVSGGSTTVEESYEGLEGAAVEISGGTVDITASDDGINAAGGSDGATGGDTARAGRFGRDSFLADNSSVRICGGSVIINASGDGIDSNGTLETSGGETYISGPTSGANGALDAAGEITLTGGVLVAAGSSGMAMAPSGSAAQACVMISYSSEQPAGTEIALCDAQGNELLRFVPEKAYSNAVLSAPGMLWEETYTLLGGGETLCTITPTEQSQTFDSSGNATSGRDMGGNPSGMGGRDFPQGGGGFAPGMARGQMDADAGTQADADGLPGSDANARSGAGDPPDMGETPGAAVPPDGITMPDGAPMDGTMGEPFAGGGPSVGGGPSAGGGLGASGEIAQGGAANTIEADAEISREGYASTGADENALRVTGTVAVCLTDVTLDKTGDTSNTGDSDFYGQNAALLATDGANLTVSGATVTTDASGANAVFSYGTDTDVRISDSVIQTGRNNSGGIHVAGGGTLAAYNLDVETQGNSAAAIRSDRGGGTLTADGGSYVTNGTGSPAIYSTADIVVSDATLCANHSEAIVVEGKNSVTLTNCDVTGSMDGTYADANDENLHNVMLYQSMSGDADVGQSSFSMSGGSLTALAGDMFYVTNTTCSIDLNGVALQYADGNLLTVAGNSSGRGWGTEGANGGDCTLTVRAQELEGVIAVDAISSLDMTMKDGTDFTGSVNPTGRAGRVDILMEAGCTWTLTADAYVTSFTGSLDDVTTNGYTLHIEEE